MCRVSIVSPKRFRLRIAQLTTPSCGDSVQPSASALDDCELIANRFVLNLEGVDQCPKRLVRRTARAGEPIQETCCHVQRFGGCRTEVYVNRQQRLSLLNPAPERWDDGRDRQDRPVATQSTLNCGQSCGGGFQGVAAGAQLGGIGDGTVNVPADFAYRIDRGLGLQREPGQIDRGETNEHKSRGHCYPSQPPVWPHTDGRRRGAARRIRRRHGERGLREWCVPG